MADEIDDRVVAMHFDNAAFEQKIANTLKSLDQLQKSLNFANGKKGFEDVQAAANSMNLDTIASGVDHIAGKFTAMGAAGFAAISNITNRFIDMGINFAKGFAFGPITDGFHEMETKVGSIQTILANTSKFGTTLPQVTDSLNKLNEYSDKTIYNFGQMTKNIGLFTNAGIKMEDATSMIQGFSNAAAASGTTAEGAANAAYQLSQALSNGSIRLMDWRSLTNVGMGNKNMQSGLIDIAKAMGTMNEAGVDANEVQAHFNETLETGWLTADVMSNYLKIMAGDMDDAKLASLGLSSAQIENFKAQQKTAEEAATKIRTWTQLVGTVKESIGSGWAQTFEQIIGDFEGASSLFTAINNAIGGFVNHMADARNAMLETWNAMNGRGTLIEGIVRIFQTLGEILNGVKYAFRNLFPATTASDLLNVTASFSDFTIALKEAVDKVLPKLVYMFGVVFSVLRIAVNIVKGVTGLFVDLFKALLPDRGGEHAIGFFGNLARALYTFNVAIINGGITKFFEYLNKILVPIAKMIGNVAGAILDFFSAFKYSDALGGALELFKQLAAAVSDFYNTVAHSEAVEAIISAVGRLKDRIAEFFAGVNYSGILGDIIKKLQQFGDVVVKMGDKVAHFAASLDISRYVNATIDLLENFGSKISDFFHSFGNGGDGLDNTKNKIKDLNEELISYSRSIDATDLSKATEAFGGAGWEEKATGIKGFFQRVQDYFASFIDTIKMYAGGVHDAFGAIRNGITKFFTGQEVLSTQSAFENVVDVLQSILITGIIFQVYRFFQEFKKLVSTAEGVFADLGDILNRFGKESKSSQLIKIGIALALLAGSLKIISDIPQEKLLASFGAMSVGLLAMMAALKGMDKGIKGGDSLKSTATSLILVAAGVRLLADGVKAFSEIDPENLNQGMIAAGLALAALAASVNLMRTSVNPGSALVVVALAGAMFLIGKAVEAFAKFKPEELAKSIIAMAAAMAGIGFALSMMGPASILAAPAVVIVAMALGLIADAIERFASLEKMDKAIAGIFFALLSIAAPLKILGPQAILGAAGILVVAKALEILFPVMEKFGSMDVEELKQAVLGLAAMMSVIVLAVNGMTSALLGAAALLVVAGALSILSDSLIKLGETDMKTLAVGIGAIAVVLLGLAAAGATLSPFIAVLGAAMLVLGAGFLLFGGGVYLAAKAFETLADVANEKTNVVLAVLEKLAHELPRIFSIFIQEVAKSAKELAKSANTISNAFANIIVGFLGAIIKVIPKIAEVVDTITTSILAFIGNRIVDFVEMGFKILLALGRGFIENAGELTQITIEVIEKVLETLTANATRLVAAGVDLILALIMGLGSKMNVIVDRGGDLIIYLMAGIAAKTLEVIAAAGAILIAFLDGVAEWIRNNAQKIHDSGVNLANAIVEGLLIGLVGKENKDKVLNKIKELAGSVIDGFMHFIGANSPSKVFMKIGGYIDEGLAIGLDKNSMAQNSAVLAAERVVSAFSETLANLPNAMDGMDELNPVITPVLDLTKVQVGARGINDMMSASISPDVSLDQARVISSTSSRDETSEDFAGASAPTQVTFIQNNHSPKALSTNDVYRNTKSQFAVAKEELKI